MKHILILLALVFSMASVNAQSTSVEAQANSSRLNFEIGQAHYTEGNYELALDEFLKAAEKGHARAQFNSGNMYYHGQGIKQSHPQAFDWTQKAALQGHANAQNNLGVMYQLGQGVTSDHVLALMWYYIADRNKIKRAKNNAIALAKNMLDAQIRSALVKSSICEKSRYQDCI